MDIFRGQSSEVDSAEDDDMSMANEGFLVVDLAMAALGRSLVLVFRFHINSSDYREMRLLVVFV